eukprot:COSAG06_NODE_1846_length_8227_cov_10.941683_3_plen_45_part_00
MCAPRVRPVPLPELELRHVERGDQLKPHRELHNVHALHEQQVLS